MSTTELEPGLDVNATQSDQSLASPITPAHKPHEPTVHYSWRNLYPDAHFSYIRDHNEANRVLGGLDGDCYGFDLEWKPCFRKGQPENPVALVQIANDKRIVILQVTAMREFPTVLSNFLTNPKIVKAGVGIQNDARKLHTDWQKNITNCVDLSLLARTVDNQQWKGKYNNPIGLARLVAAYEDLALPKGKITRSNWEQNLSQAQQDYAANDAHAGYTILMRLLSMIPSISPQTDAKYYTFDCVRGRFCHPSGETWMPFNPNYDPGPPPPPRVRKFKEPTSSQIQETTAEGVLVTTPQVIVPTMSSRSVTSASHNSVRGQQQYTSSWRLRVPAAQDNL